MKAENLWWMAKDCAYSLDEDESFEASSESLEVP